MRVIRVSTRSEGILGLPIAAHVFGTWAVHADILTDGDYEHVTPAWTVSDTRSGLAAIKNIDEPDAISVAKELRANITAPKIPMKNGDVDLDACESSEEYQDFRHIVLAIIGEVMGR